MAFRKQMSRRSSRRSFQHGRHVRKKNFSHGTARGGIRL